MGSSHAPGARRPGRLRAQPPPRGGSVISARPRGARLLRSAPCTPLQVPSRRGSAFLHSLLRAQIRFHFMSRSGDREAHLPMSGCGSPATSGHPLPPKRPLCIRHVFPLLPNELQKRSARRPCRRPQFHLRAIRVNGHRLPHPDRESTFPVLVHRRTSLSSPKTNRSLSPLLGRQPCPAGAV